jgi:hypothetical protein
LEQFRLPSRLAASGQRRRPISLISRRSPAWPSPASLPLLSRFICYRFAEPTIAALGEHGSNVVVRLSAFLLFCIGIQIVWTGFSELQMPAASLSH